MLCGWFLSSWWIVRKGEEGYNNIRITSVEKKVKNLMILTALIYLFSYIYHPSCFLHSHPLHLPFHIITLYSRINTPTRVYSVVYAGYFNCVYKYLHQCFLGCVCKLFSPECADYFSCMFINLYSLIPSHNFVTVFQWHFQSFSIHFSSTGYI